MAVGAGVAAFADVSEQAPPRTDPLGPAARQEGLVKSWRAGFRIHDVAIRQDDETYPALDSAAAEAQLLGDFPDAAPGVVKGSDLIEKSLTIGSKAAPRQLLLLRAFRPPSLATAIIYRRTRFGIRSEEGRPRIGAPNQPNCRSTASRKFWRRWKRSAICRACGAP